MATPVVQATSTIRSVNTASATVTKPTGTTENDLLVAFVMTYESTGANVANDESGWTTIASDSTGDYAIKGYRKIASASEPASYTFDTTGTTDVILVFMLRIDGHAVSAPINDFTLDLDTTTTTTPSLTMDVSPFRSDALLIAAVMSGSTSTTGISGYTISGTNPTWTERGENDIDANGLGAVASAAANSTNTITSLGYTLTSSGSIHYGFLLAIPEQADESATPASVSLTGSVATQGVTAGVNLTAPNVTLTSAFPAPTASVVRKTQWSAEAKPSTNWDNETIV